MLTLTRTVTCDLLDKEDILDALEAEHKKQPFKDYDDIFGAIQNMLLNYTDDEIYDFFWDDIKDYSDEIVDSFLESHPEIED